ncbi:unnamed protein product, partial [Rotaria magnacalcarata]
MLEAQHDTLATRDVTIPIQYWDIGIGI